MEIEFAVGGRPARFRRNPLTGRADPVVGNETVPLQSPFRASTHWSFRTTHTWHTRVGDDEVGITMSRPRLFGGARSKVFTVAVDGVVQAHGTGL
jgi:hypothetical protein